ncbi:hypothetical protein ACW0JT_08940 [Arthrobacter sp. SA17]
MMGCLERLEQLQGSDGLFGGDNLSSPPDSAFTINDAGLAVQLLRARGGGGGSESAAVLPEVQALLWQIIAKITPALVEGGVHPEPPLGIVRRARPDPQP